MPDPVKAGRLQGKIVFDDVTFSYNDQPVIKNLNLTIEPGCKVALVGPSGCGKTTLGNLILRFYDVTQGRILIDGLDIRKYSKDSYRNNVAVVLQEPFLFSGTIRDNIAYAKKNATNEEVLRAARMANVEEFVNMLPHGYKTTIGENGASLSGGQKQRIAIARAILKNPSILILDEATSALDTVSEYLVQNALDNLMEGRTTIIIAHRLSTIKNADKIVVLRAGKIEQMGTHDQLMEREGVYRELYNIQQKTALDNEASK
ncbi:putative ABC transporter ATP-binding protein [bioreactor metagenome]|uniref:Putative ABC transporter ATP-binding protein n=1 Tax=bioreactor metagenome TaxID=1076179 RepID=A0A645EDI8_9ZZZZ